MNKKKLKILLSLFALNTITLYLYFSSHPDHKSPENQQTLAGKRYSTPENHQLRRIAGRSQSKPWPILPSYLPWSQNPKVGWRSCEAYFGNGFTRRIDLLKPSPETRRKMFSGEEGSFRNGLARGIGLLKSSPETRRKMVSGEVSGEEGSFRKGFSRGIGLLKSSPEARRKMVSGEGDGWFRCFFSETLQSSICEGGLLRMSPEKISMSHGGERLESVIGRGEDEELPMFKSGAFEIKVSESSKIGKKLVDDEFLNQYVPHGVVSRHAMRELIDSIRLVGADEFQCFEWIEEPAILITRFEYANVFHTFTDFYSAYVASRVTGLPSQPHVVFVDGHCETQLEETWRALFSSLTYAKNFSGPVCFRHAILSPLGYETALFKGLSENIDCHGASSQDLWQNPDDKKTARLSEFGEMIRAAFGFPVDRPHIPRTVNGLYVLFVRREDYLAHPRHGGKVQSRLSNEQQVFDSIKSWASNHTECKLHVINGLFAHMPMKEQVRAIQDASVIVGAHGAGLTHIVSAAPKAVILEIISSEYRRPHFALIAQWKGLEYHPIFLDGSFADPPIVIEKLSYILKSLSC